MTGCSFVGASRPNTSGATQSSAGSHANVRCNMSFSFWSGLVDLRIGDTQPLAELLEQVAGALVAPGQALQVLVEQRVELAALVDLGVLEPELRQRVLDLELQAPHQLELRGVGHELVVLLLVL